MASLVDAHPLSGRPAAPVFRQFHFSPIGGGAEETRRAANPNRGGDWLDETPRMSLVPDIRPRGAARDPAAAQADESPRVSLVRPRGASRDSPKGQVSPPPPIYHDDDDDARQRNCFVNFFGATPEAASGASLLRACDDYLDGEAPDFPGGGSSGYVSFATRRQGVRRLVCAEVSDEEAGIRLTE